MTTNDVPMPPVQPVQESEPAPAPPPPVPAVSSTVSPGAAVLLSFLPGLGHVYLGLYSRALVLFLTFFVAVTLAGHTDNLGLIAAFVWFFGPIDAYRQARLINLAGRREKAPGISSWGSGTLGLGIFLTIVGAILLIDRFYPIDLDWLADWWPAILVAAGLYLIGSALVERSRAREASSTLDWDEPDEGV